MNRPGVHHQQLLSAILDSTLDALISTDGEGVVQLFNRAAERLFGWSAQEVLGRNVKMLMPPYISSHHDGFLERYQRTGVPHVIGIGRETEAMRKDGTVFPIHLSLAEVDLPNRPKGPSRERMFSGIIRDVSEKKAHQRQIFQDRERLQAILNSTLDALIAIDGNGTVQLFNRAAEKMFQRPASEVLGHNVKMLMPPSISEHHDGFLERYQRTGVPHVIGIGRETEAMRKDGTVFPIHLSLAEVESDSLQKLPPERRYFTGTISDYTEKKAQQRRIREDQEKYERDLREFTDTICHEIRNPLQCMFGHLDMIRELLDTIKEREPASSNQMFSLQAPNVSGQTQSTGSLASQSSQASNGAMMQELATAFSALLSCAEHQKMIVDNVLHASKLDAHKVVVERALYSPAKMVKAVVQMFTPLVAQKGLAVKTDIHVPGTLLVVGDEARCRQVLINFLSNAVKYTQQGAITIQLRMLPPDAVIGPVQSEPNPFALLPSSSAEANKFPFLPPRQNTSPSDTSALKNLLFTGKSGDERQIRDCLLQFSVVDTGPGMSDEESQALFQRFCRLGQSSNQDYASFGLGLSISRELVNLMGGRISVESQKGHGSTFSFTVRCSAFTDAQGIVLDPQIRQTVERSGEWVPPALPILVVEDNPLNQVILKRMLLQLGCKAEVACDGAEAVDLFAARPFAAVLMDVEMPRMSGLDASRCIREMERRTELMTGSRLTAVPIIGLSGNAREEQRAEALQCGMNDYLTKPVRKPDLFQALQQARFRTMDVTSLMAQSVMVETPEFSLESFRAELIAGTRKRRAAPLMSDRT